MAWPSVLAMLRSYWTSRAVVSVALLSAGSGSVVPAGGLTVAVLDSVPVALTDDVVVVLSQARIMGTLAEAPQSTLRGLDRRMWLESGVALPILLRSRYRKSLVGSSPASCPSARPSRCR